MDYVVAVTGASGAIYARRLLRALAREGAHIRLIISAAGRLVMAHELGIELPADPVAAKKRVRVDLLEEDSYPYLDLYDVDDLAARPASGSAASDGMIILPCSMGALGRIAAGSSSNLIERAADVTLKEKRPLVIAPRETPLSYLHLRNMLELSRAGAHILPCAPAFYHQPREIGQLADFMVGKIFDLLGIEHSLYKRWQG